jgi:hypothetical protein
LTIKSTSHTRQIPLADRPIPAESPPLFRPCERYFLALTCVVGSSPYSRRLADFVCPSNIQLSKISIASATG